jgi:hypothetical protein
MSETDKKTRAAQTRCYVHNEQFILRTKGAEDAVVSTPNIPVDVQKAFSVEMIALLLLRGSTMTEIVAGKGLPDRALPNGKEKKEKGPRQLNQVRRAILAARIADLKKEARGNGSKLDGQTVAVIMTTAEAWVRGLTDDQAARLVRAEAVQIELAKLRGTKATLDELMAEPGPMPEEEAA